MKDQGGSGLSAEQFGLLGMPSAASHMVREAHPKNLSQVKPMLSLLLYAVQVPGKILIRQSGQFQADGVIDTSTKSFT